MRTKRNMSKLASRPSQFLSCEALFCVLTASSACFANLFQTNSALLEANPDKLVIIKTFSKTCIACKKVAPKFIAMSKDEQYQNLPIIWAEFPATQANKNVFRRLEVLALPTMLFYDGSNGLVENFACGPKKIPIFKQKLTQFLNSRVDPETRLLKQQPDGGTDDLKASPPCAVRKILMETKLVTEEHLEYLRNGMPFFQNMTDDEFDTLLSKARLLTFMPGNVIMRQGMPPKNFWVIKNGLVEMSIKSRFDDPISTPPSYLGAVVNQLTDLDYFGERALSTGEPYAASVRALKKTRCFVFDVDDIPESSILSKTRRATSDMVKQLTKRYKLPKDYISPAYPATVKDESILELLVRFKQIRQAAKCFEYVMSTKPLLGDRAEIARRSILVSKLSKSLQEEFVEVFNIADANKSGTISLLEMRRFMESARKGRTDKELLEMISKANPRLEEGSKYGTGITLDEFMGVMAEAEFYSLFTETFQELDQENTGYVRIGDLDEALHGVRDLISNDQKSIIDIEDQDVQVDYEQFAKMLLGASL